MCYFFKILKEIKKMPRKTHILIRIAPPYPKSKQLDAAPGHMSAIIRRVIGESGRIPIFTPPGHERLRPAV